MSAADHKALAISSGPIGLSTGQADDDTAKAAALDLCQKRADALPHCAKQDSSCRIIGIGPFAVEAK